jgi:hypothetical protein
MDAFETTGSSPTLIRAVELFRMFKRQGYVSVRIGAITGNYTTLSEQDILNAAARLGLTVQTIAGSLWIRL